MRIPAASTAGTRGARLSTLVRTFGGGLVPSARGDIADTFVDDVHIDSRLVENGTLFCALPGTQIHGARYVSDAARRGAAAVLMPHGDGRLISDLAADAPTVWVHADARRVAGLAAGLVYGAPARALDVVGVTGTNGKTTVAHLLGDLLDRSGRKAAVLGTAGHRIAARDGSERIGAALTTPDATEVHRLLARHRAAGGDACVMEVSSHALVQERTAGVTFRIGIFTNLTREHLDYHGTLARYARAKATLFQGLGPGGVAVVNADDPAWEIMAGAAVAGGARVITYSTRSRADLRAARLRLDREGSQFLLEGMGISKEETKLPLRGRHNVENALAAVAAMRALGASSSAVVEGLAASSPAPGRLERVGPRGGGVEVYVDYAHSPDALERVLRTLREGLPAGGGGRLSVVFGCGGDRDVGKRSLMGAIAGELADFTIVTSDNPRSEDPERIAADVLAGVYASGGAHEVELDRRRAIVRAIELARPCDVILIAGKGHENTQIVGARVLPFDDRVVAQEVLG